jgi:hypothetical protein
MTANKANLNLKSSKCSHWCGDLFSCYSSLYVLCLYICCIMFVYKFVFCLILIRTFVSIIKCKIYNTHFGHLHMKLALHSTFTHSFFTFCTMIKGGKSEWFFFIHYKEFANKQLDLWLIFNHNYHTRLATRLSHLNKLYKILLAEDNT